MKLHIQCNHSQGKNALESERTSHTFPLDKAWGGGKRPAWDLGRAWTRGPVKALVCLLYKVLLIPHRLQEPQFKRSKRAASWNNANTWLGGWLCKLRAVSENVSLCVDLDCTRSENCLSFSLSLISSTQYSPDLRTNKENYLQFTAGALTMLCQCPLWITLGNMECQRPHQIILLYSSLTSSKGYSRLRTPGSGKYSPAHVSPCSRGRRPSPEKR